MKFIRALETKRRKNNTSEVTGVSITDVACSARIETDGEVQTKKYSIKLYGREEALRLAILWRRSKELEMHGYTVIPDELTYRTEIHEQSIKEADETRRKIAEEKENKREILLEKYKRDRLIYKKISGKYIYRLDHFDTGHGWYLHIPHKNNSLVDKFFADSAYGSKIKALEEAQKLRTKILEENNLPYAENRKYSHTTRKVNKSGVTGVIRNNAKNSYNAWIYEEPRKVKRRTFNINKYGDEFTAYCAAVEWRRDKEIEVYGGTILTDEHLEAVYANFDELLANMKK